MRPTGTHPHGLTRVDWPTFHQVAQEAGATLPVEQTDAWDRFDEAMEGREPWGRLVWSGADGQPRALMSFTRMAVRGFPYLWGRHAPVWLGGEPTPEEELALRRALVGALRERDRSIVFVRMHDALGPERSLPYAALVRAMDLKHRLEAGIGRALHRAGGAPRSTPALSECGSATPDEYRALSGDGGARARQGEEVYLLCA